MIKLLVVSFYLFSIFWLNLVVNLYTSARQEFSFLSLLHYHMLFILITIYAYATNFLYNLNTVIV